MLSYYEVYITSLRAYTAMGFPYGLNEDAAYMTTWLELHKFNGIKKLSELTKNYKKHFKKKIDLNKLKSDKLINFDHSSLLFNGPGLFDILYEKTKKNKNLEITLQNCYDPIYVIPLIRKLSNKLYSIKACWLNKNKKNYCINIKKNKIFIGEIKNHIKMLDGEIILQFLLNKNKNYKWKNDLDIKKIKQEINFNIEQKQLENSLHPKKLHWNVVLKIAKRTFVPSSIKSRERGAGGGDDND